MSRSLLCTIYLLIAISTVHSASYFYRAGREVIVPTLEEVKEVISELKKEQPVALEPIIAGPIGVVPENVVAAIENVENNMVADVEPLAIKAVVNDEARAKPAPVLRLDTLEVISADKSDKVITVAETVKNAAVQAIEKQNEEIQSAKPVDEILPIVTETKVVDTPAAVKSVDEPVVPVEKIDAIVKSPESVVAPVVVKEENVEPAVEVKKVEPVETVDKVEKIEKIEETVRSADSEPPKPDNIQDEIVGIDVEELVAFEKAASKPSSSDKQKQKEKPEKQKEKPSQENEKPERQQAGGPGASAPNNPLNQIQTAFNQFTNNIQQALNNVISNSKFVCFLIFAKF